MSSLKSEASFRDSVYVLLFVSELPPQYNFIGMQKQLRHCIHWFSLDIQSLLKLQISFAVAAITVLAAVFQVQCTVAALLLSHHKGSPIRYSILYFFNDYKEFFDWTRWRQ